jgi:hypothetical protein
MFNSLLKVDYYWDECIAQALVWGVALGPFPDDGSMKESPYDSFVYKSSSPFSFDLCFSIASSAPFVSHFFLYCP